MSHKENDKLIDNMADLLNDDEIQVPSKIVIQVLDQNDEIINQEETITDGGEFMKTDFKRAEENLWRLFRNLKKHE